MSKPTLMRTTLALALVAAALAAGCSDRSDTGGTAGGPATTTGTEPPASAASGPGTTP